MAFKTMIETQKAGLGGWSPSDSSGVREACAKAGVDKFVAELLHRAVCGLLVGDHEPHWYGNVKAHNSNASICKSTIRFTRYPDNTRCKAWLASNKYKAAVVKN